eukprot:TRINITY_DN8447_c0_g1_i1.p1 TRINITY_DN8447_c0_g1~~TRINITY_DN8447_c0_g1_i1.p1  ORF type:complete len:366 (+),score=52.30 TRINITY_DN8447_c0_g1_i1:66-1163(+)
MTRVRSMLFALLVQSACADRIKHSSMLEPGADATGPELEQDTELATVHDLDDEAAHEVGYTVHTEENCETCIQGDILTPPDSNASSFLQSENSGNIWPNGIVYFKWKPGISSEIKTITETAMKVWEAKTCIRFEKASSKPKSHSESFPVNIGSDEQGCNAHAGFYGAAWQNMNLGNGCNHLGTALHELGHVIGLSHEHERFDRDAYVRMNFNNIQANMQRWFHVNPWRSQQAQKLPYDLSSIMHYDAWAFAITRNYSQPETAAISVVSKDHWGNCQIGQRAQLSIGDIETIAVMYSCRPDTKLDREAHRDHQCMDKPGGYRGYRCSEAPKRRFADGQPFCDTVWVQKVCPRSCGACPAEVFCETH